MNCWLRAINMKIERQRNISNNHWGRKKYEKTPKINEKIGNKILDFNL